MKMYYDDDVNTDALEGKTIAVIGYGSQGRAQSRNMADSGAKKCTIIKLQNTLKLETLFHSLTVTTSTSD